MMRSDAMLMQWATSNKITGVKIYPDGAINMKNAKMAK